MDTGNTCWQKFTDDILQSFVQSCCSALFVQLLRACQIKRLGYGSYCFTVAMSRLVKAIQHRCSNDNVRRGHTNCRSQGSPKTDSKGSKPQRANDAPGRICRLEAAFVRRTDAPHTHQRGREHVINLMKHPT